MVESVAVLADIHGVLPVLDAVLAEPEVRTVVCGHTHMPFVRLVDRRLVLNPGSVGMPHGRPGGHWALLRNGDVSLRRVEIDVDATVAQVVAQSTYSDREARADDYIRSASSDAEAVTNFGRPVAPKRIPFWSGRARG